MRKPCENHAKTGEDRMVYAWKRECKQVFAWFSHGLRMISHGLGMVYAIRRNPHLNTSSRGEEAPTCPETSPWPTRSYAIAWSRRIYLEQSQPDHLDSTGRRGHRNPPDSAQWVQTEWFQCPLPALVTAFPGWNRQESHRPAVPAQVFADQIRARRFRYTH
jgi:hypothetical protein